LIWSNHVTFWWRKDGEGFNSHDDIRFVTARYRAGGPWVTLRKEYSIPERTGIAVRFRGDWHFFGHMRFRKQPETRTVDQTEE